MTCTERDYIQSEVNQIKNMVESSSMNYFIEESHYTAKIYLKKKARHDWSDDSNPHPRNSTPVNNSRLRTSSSPLSAASQCFPAYLDSAYQTQLLETPVRPSDTLQKTKEKEELAEAHKTINKLKNEIKDKVKTISQAESNLKKSCEEKDFFKKERDSKCEQLKQKDKEIKEKDKEIKEKDEEITEQSKKISVLSNSLDEKRKEIKEKEEINSGLTKYTVRKEEEFLKEYEPKLNELSNSLDEKRKELKNKAKK